MTRAKTMRGAVCEACNTDERYAKNGKCVFCARKRKAPYDERYKIPEDQRRPTGGFANPPAFLLQPMKTPDFRKDNEKGKLL